MVGLMKKLAQNQLQVHITSAISHQTVGYAPCGLRPLPGYRSGGRAMRRVRHLVAAPKFVMKENGEWSHLARRR
jgi:hypothetical protein